MIETDAELKIRGNKKKAKRDTSIINDRSNMRVAVAFLTNSKFQNGLLYDNFTFKITLWTCLTLLSPLLPTTHILPAQYYFGKNILDDENC